MLNLLHSDIVWIIVSSLNIFDIVSFKRVCSCMRKSSEFRLGHVVRNYYFMLLYNERYSNFDNLMVYWKNMILWWKGRSLVHDLNPIVLPCMRFIKPRSVFHKIPSSFSLQLVAKVRGDVTLIHIPGVCEVCHGYPPLRTPNPRICVMRNGVPMYGRTTSINEWHVYTFHFTSCRTFLLVDDRIEIDIRHTIPQKMKGHKLWIGCTNMRQYKCRGYLPEIRLVAEPYVSSITRKVHSSLVQMYVEADENIVC